MRSLYVRPSGDGSCRAARTTNFGTPMRSARLSISRQAIAGKPGMEGSARKLDSCSVTASTAHTFSSVGAIPWVANAA